MNRLVALGVTTALVAACAGDRSAPTATEVRVPLYARGGQLDNLGTHLHGEEEVFAPATPGGPTPADSRAQGQAIFRVSDDGSSVDFKLIASNIDNAFMAHIHCGRFGTNGPIVMWLYPSIGPTGTPGPLGSGRHAGVLAEGTFTPGSLTCAPANTGLAQPISLLAAMRAGLVYVNVHTNDGVAPTNTGPGDFPGGEIRGQLD